MLAFGDLSYLPFLYPLSAFFLVNHSPNWPLFVWVGVFGLGVFAYYAFRRSNAERNEFKLGRLSGAKYITMVRRSDGSSVKYLIRYVYFVLFSA